MKKLIAAIVDALCATYRVTVRFGVLCIGDVPVFPVLDVRIQRIKK